MNRSNTWDQIVAETSARPLPLSEEHFRAWMGRQGIFVSSLMDPEMTPYRNAVRAYLRGAGATPIMWEEITPQDKSAQHAYLDGVDRATIFVLMLGRRYGIADASGASPTHKEAIRAAERHVLRWLFLLGGVNPSERDVKLNDWLGTLYNEVSGASFDTPETLVSRLDAQLREKAAEGERTWIKLGNLVFPGKAKSGSGAGGGKEFTVTARVSAGRVRHALMELGAPFGRNRPERLTWSEYSYPIQVVSSASESEFTAEDAVEIRCQTPNNWYGESGSSVTMMGMDSKDTWVRQAFFGEQPAPSGRRGYDLERAFSAPDAKTLPEVLSEVSAGGWLAEGLTRLYVVEEVARRYGGRFLSSEVGPATARGVRVKGSFEARSGRNETATVEGIVPLRRA
ncbi:MAG TPA: DUF4062 domain-containing protein [Pyrinomonadaceae bacterium]|jgi:hypothetical protein